MNILFVSDYVCPYCEVAKKSMAEALSQLGITADITWQPFELTMEPKPRVDTYHDDARKAHYKILENPCKELGLDMKLPPNIVPRPYTRLAFEGFYYADKHGCGDAYNTLVYDAYFIDELDISDVDVLCELAKKAGLDPVDFRKALAEGTYKQKLLDANQYDRDVLLIRHVPTIYVDGNEISISKYTVDEFLTVFNNILQQNELEGEGFHGCTPEGC